jgi:hypothetical protein
MNRSIIKALKLMPYVLSHPSVLIPKGRGLYAVPAMKKAAKLNLHEIKIEMLLPDLMDIFYSVSIKSFVPKSFPVALAVRFLNAKNAFEFGTYRGITTLTIAHNMQQGTIYTLDIASKEAEKHIDEMIPSDRKLATVDDIEIGMEFRNYEGYNKIIQLLPTLSRPYADEM